ncbi:hypothetical protein, partial [Paenibacillus sp. JGP012]|uniref:hypothetical protein n=1 Tax=Paenibacillus sp. JGP012 TaxID=2735914 RepID=UPI001C87F953
CSSEMVVLSLSILTYECSNMEGYPWFMFIIARLFLQSHSAAFVYKSETFGEPMDIFLQYTWFID